MQYNQDQYNRNAYNVGLLLLALFETINNSDSKVNDDSAIKVETLTLVDLLQKFFSGQYLNETVTLSDAALKQYLANKIDLMLLTDTLSANILKSALETLTLVDIKAVSLLVSRVDTMTLTDIVTKAITDKRLSESIRLQSWLSVKRKGSNWSN